LTRVKTLLLTRPQAQSRALAKDIEANFPGQARCIIAPLMKITPVGELPDTTNFQAVLFTSVNGVQSFAELGGDKNTSCYCVGARTAVAARDAGLNAISADGAADDLIALVAKDLKPEEGALLYIRGENTAGNIAEKLSERGFKVNSQVLYQQIGCDLPDAVRSALEQGEVHGLPLYSPLTARRLVKVLAANPDWPTDEITALCISENVASEVNNLSLARVKVAAKPNGAEMLALIGQFLR
jgi:uroporphyrinogen-III synthase